MRRTLYCMIAASLTVLFLYGCATQITVPQENALYSIKPGQHHHNATTGPISWHIQGAASIQSQGKTQMATFTWQQINNHYAINLYGPLNLGSIGIAGTPSQVVLNKPTGRYVAATPEALMQQQLGWYLPISNMYYWIRGLPAPGRCDKQLHDPADHLILLQQQGWQIQFAAFQPSTQGDLPRRIILDNPQLHVRLVINHWNIAP